MRQKKGSGNSRNVLLLFSLSPPQTLFFKNTLGFLFSLVFSFSSVITFNIPCFSSTPFQILFSFCFFGLMNRPLWKTCLENTFSYHMGLRGGTWEDGPQSAVFSACLHPEFNINLCYKRSGSDKRVVFQKGGFPKGWFWRTRSLICSWSSSFWFSQPFRFGKTMVVFLCNSSNPLERPFCFFFCSVLSSFFFLPFLSLLLSFKASSIASPFPNPSFLHLGPPGFSVVGVLIVVVFFIFVFWLIFLFLFVSVVLLWDYDNKRRFPCNKRGASIADTNKGFPAIREMFCLFSPPPPRPLFKTTLGWSFSLVFFFCHPFQHCFFSSTPFEILFLFRFFGLIFVAPFLSSFLLRSFQPVSCHPLLQSTLLSF